MIADTQQQNHDLLQQLAKEQREIRLGNKEGGKFNLEKSIETVTNLGLISFQQEERLKQILDGT